MSITVAASTAKHSPAKKILMPMMPLVRSLSQHTPPWLTQQRWTLAATTLWRGVSNFPLFEAALRKCPFLRRMSWLSRHPASSIYEYEPLSGAHDSGASGAFSACLTSLQDRRGSEPHLGTQINLVRSSTL